MAIGAQMRRVKTYAEKQRSMTRAAVNTDYLRFLELGMGSEPYASQSGEISGGARTRGTRFMSGGIKILIFTTVND